MIATLLADIQLVFLTLGPWGVFALGFLQEVIPPIPSTVVTVSAGFFFLEGDPLTFASFYKLFLFVGLPIAGGLALGSLFVYGVVYWGGKPLVLRFGKYLGVSWNEIEKVSAYLEGHRWDDALLFVARSLPIMPSIALNVFCGLTRWRPVSFFLITFFGTIIRSMVSGFIGWQFANVYQNYASVAESSENILLVFFIVAVGAYLYYRKRKTGTPEQTGVV